MLKDFLYDKRTFNIPLVVINDNRLSKINKKISCRKKQLMNSDFILIKIGANIKTLREEQGMSQQILAAKCNFEKANMSRIEAGRTNFTILTLSKISKALNIPLAKLLEFDE